MPEGLTLIVCGGRDYTDSRAVFGALDRIRSTRGVCKVLHGGARGADELAGRWAEDAGVEVQVFEADWERHGKAAGPVRNQAMADAGADGCIAFPGGHGTADMVRRAEAANIRVWKPYG
jgi:hypothetical protein